MTNNIDFALFENVVTGINHQKDVHIIAQMLRDSGFKTVILGYCNEEEETNGVPLVNIKNPYPKPLMGEGNKFNFLLRLSKYHLNKKRYINYFIHEVHGMARNYYCGSFLQETDSRFLKQYINANYFFWGLRSHLLKMRWSDFYNPIEAFRKWRKIRLVKTRSNVKFFVSNELIRQEFIEIGISSERLVLRPERFADETTTSANFNNPFTFLSIGTIRPVKRIPFIIDAFKSSRCHQKTMYNIAGRCGIPELEKKIVVGIGNDEQIKRDSKRLTEAEYVHYFHEAHFLIIADIQQKSSVTNGTMMEALLMGKPIIAPNYDPYKHYIEKYNIGILFDGESIASLSDAMDQAYKLGGHYFEEQIDSFKLNYTYGKILDQFKQKLHSIGITPTKDK